MVRMRGEHAYPGGISFPILSRYCGYGSGYPEYMRECDLIKRLREFGTVTHFYLVRDRDTGRPDGTFYVQYASTRELVDAMKMIMHWKVQGYWELWILGSTFEFVTPRGHWGTGYTHSWGTQVEDMESDRGSWARSNLRGGNPDFEADYHDFRNPWYTFSDRDVGRQPMNYDGVWARWGPAWEGFSQFPNTWREHCQVSGYADHNRTGQMR